MKQQGRSKVREMEEQVITQLQKMKLKKHFQIQTVEQTMNYWYQMWCH